MPIWDSNMLNGMPHVADAPIVELGDLSAGYGEIQVLWDVSMVVRTREITALIGSNGAGKTTLMRALSGLIPIRSGRYFSDGADLSSARKIS
jgi:branched-chain amino acid transport system ATP-binding protein